MMVKAIISIYMKRTCTITELLYESLTIGFAQNCTCYTVFYTVFSGMQHIAAAFSVLKIIYR